MKTKQTYPTCPSCGATDFYVDGFVTYRQPYDAKAAEYGMSEVFWDEDYATAAKCAGCDRDATALFKKHDVLAFFNLRLKKR